MLSCADNRDYRCMTGLQKRNGCGKMVLFNVMQRIKLRKQKGV